MPAAPQPAAPTLAATPTPEPALDLKEACVRAAHEVIAEHGVERLSLRDVARRLGVSHQAPYKHYPSRDHLLAEVIRRCFEDFARWLDAREPQQNDPQAELAELGERYLRFAADHSLEYRLMFGTPWPAPAEHPDLVRDARHAFDVLRGVLLRVHADGPDPQGSADLDAMFIWSAMHGLATIAQSDVMPHLALAPGVAGRIDRHAMGRLAQAMASTGPPPTAPTSSAAPASTLAAVPPPTPRPTRRRRPV